MIRRIGVVIPARNEGDRVQECLDSIVVARAQVHLPVDVFIVADSCSDATADFARRYDGVTVLEIDASNVGTARAVGARAAIASGADWLSFTDADSIVPPHWLTTHQWFADLGYDTLIGTVQPDNRELTSDQLARWRMTHTRGQATGHVHGANLGVRSDPYLAAGGFDDLPEHEDVDLVDRMSAWRTAATDACEVVTSARAVGRTPGGYAGYLRENGLAAG